jgi:Na+/proline symporter
MTKRIILGILAGCVLSLLTEALGFYLITLIVSSQVMTLLSILLIVLCPFAGGFLTGLLVGKDHARSGLIAGLGAGLCLGIAALFILGATRDYILVGIFLVLSWGFFARLGASLAKTTRK